MSKRRWLRLLGIGLIALLSLAPATAVQAKTTHHKFRGEFAEVYFSDVQDGKFIDFYLLFRDETVKSDPGQPSSNIYISGWIYQYDSSRGESTDIYISNRKLEPGSFRVKGNLNGATLNTTLVLKDWPSDTSFPVQLSFTWEGAGDLLRETYRVNYESPIGRVQGHSVGMERGATVAGSISSARVSFSGAALPGTMAASRSAAVFIERKEQ